MSESSPKSPVSMPLRLCRKLIRYYARSKGSVPISLWKFCEPFVDRSVSIVRSRINGNVQVGAQTRIQYSKISGDVDIGDHALISEVRISGNIKIGRHTSVNGPNTDIYSMIHPVSIGNFCSIARNVSIQEYNHAWSRCSSYMVQQHIFGGNRKQDVVSSGPIVIGNDVWIGTQSVILSGASVGDGAVIGANSTVTGFVPPYAIAVGSPARVVRYRFKESIIERLLELQWWLWTDEQILGHRSLFEGDLSSENLAALKM